jgi:electron transfer flavoprotein alpha subunit
MMITAGLGAKNALPAVRALAARFGASLGATRRMVDEGLLPYEMQVGLTGKRVNPKVYLAVGVSGAVHHLVGMERSGTVIAVNPDPKAPIFDYADFGIVATAEELAALV